MLCLSAGMCTWQQQLTACPAVPCTQILELKVIHRKHRTGFEESKDFPIRINDLIAGRYHVRTWALSHLLLHCVSSAATDLRQASTRGTRLRLADMLPCYQVAP
jgi:hypothetical protein